MPQVRGFWSRLLPFGRRVPAAAPVAAQPRLFPQRMPPEPAAVALPSAETAGIAAAIAPAVAGASLPAPAAASDATNTQVATGERAEAHRVLAEIKHLSSIGRPSHALALCEDYFRDRPGFLDDYRHPVYLKESLRLCLMLDRIEQARDIASRLKPLVAISDPCVPLLFARHFVARNQRSDARAEWLNVLARDPRNAEGIKWLTEDARADGRAFGGFAGLSVFDNRDLSSFACGDRDERLQVFDPMVPQAGPPLCGPEALPHFVTGSYNAATEAPAGAIYALRDCTLTGSGLLVRGQAFVSPPDVFPLYLHHRLSARPDELDTNLLGAIGRSDADILHYDRPLATALHPNLVWGHFLVEMLPRLYLLGVLARMGRPFAIALPSTVSDWAKRFVGIYAEPDDIVSYDPRTQCVEAPVFIVPSMMQTNWRLSPVFNLMVSDLFSRCGVPENVVPDGPRLLYLSRAQFGGGRRLLNEPDVEQTLRGLGFTIVHPQQMSLPEQLRLFHGADVVVSEYNSSLHNTLFARAGTRVVALNCHNHLQTEIARIRGQSVAFVPPDDGVRRDSTKKGEARNFSVDCEKMRAVVLSRMEGVGDVRLPR